MPTAIGKFNLHLNNTPFSQLAGSEISLVEPNLYTVAKTQQSFNSQQLIQLKNSNFITFYNIIPEFNIDVSPNLPSSVFVELLEEEYRTKQFKIMRQQQNQQVNQNTNIEKSQPWRTQAISYFVYNSIIPGFGYILQKRYGAFLLYSVNLYTAFYLMWLIFPNKFVGVLIIAIINYFVSIHMHNESLYIGKFGVSKNLEAGLANPFLAIFPVAYMVLQILNFIFGKGNLFANAGSKIIQLSGNYLPLQNWLNHSFSLVYFLTNITVYLIIFMIIFTITLGILIVFKSTLIKRLQR